MGTQEWAVITGASSGIGAELARLLSKRGYGIVLVARRRERLEELAAKLDGPSRIITADLGQTDECDRVMSEVADLDVSVFVNNAGFGDCGTFATTDEAKELQMIDVNVRALHLLTKRAVQLFQARGAGRVLNVASSAGLMPGGPYMATYYATKAYAASLSQAVAQELREQPGCQDIHVSCLCPGPVDTEFNDVANVRFSLPGISAAYCAECAVEGLFANRVLIVPSLRMKAACVLGRLAPRGLAVRIAGQQQRRKLDA